MLPPNNERILKHTLVVEHAEESRHVLLLLWRHFDEVQTNHLHESFDAKLAILLHKVEEGSFVFCPVLDTISLALEHATEEQVVLVVGGDVKDELGVTHFLQQFVAGAIALTHKFVEVFNFLL